MGPCILSGLLPPSGLMMSRHRSRSHVPETVTETETLLRVIEISKHKIYQNIKLTLLMKKNISGPFSGPFGTRNFNGPDGPDAVMAPVMESQA